MKQFSLWIRNERRIRLIHMFLLYRHVLFCWIAYVKMRQPLRVLRREKTENQLRNTFTQWRLHLRVTRCRKFLQATPSVLNGLKLNGFMDHSWSSYMSSNRLRYIAFQTWLLRTYRMSWDRECKRRQLRFSHEHCRTSVIHALRQWNAWVLEQQR